MSMKQGIICLHAAQEHSMTSFIPSSDLSYGSAAIRTTLSTSGSAEAVLSAIPTATDGSRGGMVFDGTWSSTPKISVNQSNDAPAARTFRLRPLEEYCRARTLRDVSRTKNRMPVAVGNAQPEFRPTHHNAA